MSFRYRASIVGFVAVVLLASTAYSSGAFTSTSLERQGTVSVTADDTALIALIDGHPGSGLIEQTSDGTIEIDFTRGGATGATEGALFEFGSTTSPATDHGFRIVNQGPAPRDLTVDFTLSGSDGGDPAPNVEFRLYHDAGSDGSIEDQTSVSEEDAAVTFADVAPGDTVYVVVTVDTRNLGAGADLSGDLSVEARS